MVETRHMDVESVRRFQSIWVAKVRGLVNFRVPAYCHIFVCTLVPIPLGINETPALYGWLEL